MKRLIPLLLISAMSLSGCRNTNNMFAGAWGLNTMTRNASSELLDANKITAAEGQHIKDVNDEAASALNSAWKIRLVNKDVAKTTVQKETESLKLILNFLESKGTK
jgi:hypothetical protein